MGRLILLSILTFLFLLWARRRYCRKRLTLRESKDWHYVIGEAGTIEYD